MSSCTGDCSCTGGGCKVHSSMLSTIPCGISGQMGSAGGCYTSSNSDSASASSAILVSAGALFAVGFATIHQLN